MQAIISEETAAATSGHAHTVPLSITHERVGCPAQLWESYAMQSSKDQTVSRDPCEHLQPAGLP